MYVAIEDTSSKLYLCSIGFPTTETDGPTVATPLESISLILLSLHQKIDRETKVHPALPTKGTPSVFFQALTQGAYRARLLIIISMLDV